MKTCYTMNKSKEYLPFRRWNISKKAFGETRKNGGTGKLTGIEVGSWFKA
jgi:hypothetical protein